MTVRDLDPDDEGEDDDAEVIEVPREETGGLFTELQDPVGPDNLPVGDFREEQEG